MNLKNMQTYKDISTPAERAGGLCIKSWLWNILKKTYTFCEITHKDRQNNHNVQTKKGNYHVFNWFLVCILARGRIVDYGVNRKGGATKIQIINIV